MKLQILYVKQLPSKFVSNDTFEVRVNFTIKILHLQLKMCIQLYTVKTKIFYVKNNSHYIFQILIHFNYSKFYYKNITFVMVNV